ncbi:Os01g0349000, partial [Oryza sativa Japonica Group]
CGSLTCGAHVGATLTQPPRRTKPGHYHQRTICDRFWLVKGRWIPGFVVGGRFCNSMTS